MEFHIAGIALEVIEDHNEALIGARIHIREQGDHAGAFDEVPAARHIVREYCLNLVAFGIGVLAASVFLTIETGTVLCLFFS